MGNGRFLDTEDLEEKYKSKPEQLAAIYKNARTILCPVREVQLWEDPEFSSSASRGSESRRETTRRAEQIDNKFHVKAKKPKVTSEARPAEELVPVGLTEAQIKKTETLLKSIEEILQKSTQASTLLDDETNGVKAFVPHKAPHLNFKLIMVLFYKSHIALRISQKTLGADGPGHHNSQGDRRKGEVGAGTATGACNGLQENFEGRPRGCQGGARGQC